MIEQVGKKAVGPGLVAGVLVAGEAATCLCCASAGEGLPWGKKRRKELREEEKKAKGVKWKKAGLSGENEKLEGFSCKTI